LFPVYTVLVIIVIVGLWVGRPGNRRSIYVDNFFSFFSTSRPNRLRVPPSWGRERYALRLKQAGCEADHLSVSTFCIKYARSYTFCPPHPFVACCLIRNRDSSAFYPLAGNILCCHIAGRIKTAGA